MRVGRISALLAGVGLAVAGVNVAAALSTPVDPDLRVPYVDPFAPAVAGGLAPGEAAVQAAPGEAIGAASDQSAGVASDDPAGQPVAPGAASSAAADSSSAATVSAPVSQTGTLPALHLPQTLDQWVSSTAAATGIPARAVQAYGNATLEITVEDPGCRLGWLTLAAIGWIESGHGTHGGAALGTDGRPSVLIVGPALDGRPGRAAIHSTPQSVAWHGDPVWDHAVGPMQFIPSTWARWGADGDGDGVADPQDVDDAALATARYLCAGARDLSTWEGWHAAVLSYNHAEAYVQSVYTRAGVYAAAVSG